jgi:hypothetical protein
MRILVLFIASTAIHSLLGCATPNNPHRLTLPQAYGFSDPWGDAPWHSETSCGRWKVQRVENSGEQLYIATSWVISSEIANIIRSINGIESFTYQRYEGVVTIGPYADRPLIFSTVTNAMAADCQTECGESPRRISICGN